MTRGTRILVLGLACGLLAGCQHTEPKLDKALLNERTPAAHGADADRLYVIHIPDEVEIAVLSNPPLKLRQMVNTEGKIQLADHGPARLDGLNTREATFHVAALCGVPPGKVQVRVVGFHSQKLYLFGEVAGLQRAVAYQGPESVVDLLQRAGGLTDGAATREIQIVRSHVADGNPPEVFKVDLEAILVKKDQETNVRLQAFDHVYIGETRQARMRNCLPPWARGFYEKLSGMKRP